MTRATRALDDEPEKVPAKVAAKAAGKRKAAEEAAAAEEGAAAEEERAPSPAPPSPKALKPTPIAVPIVNADLEVELPSEGAVFSLEEEAGSAAHQPFFPRPASPPSNALALVGSLLPSPTSAAPGIGAGAVPGDLDLELLSGDVPHKKGKEAKGGSAFKGVYLDKTVANKSVNKWKSSIRISQKEVHLGYYASEEEAARAYDKACICTKGVPKNLAVGNFTEEEFASLRAMGGDVNTLRKEMGVGVMVGLVLYYAHVMHVSSSRPSSSALEFPIPPCSTAPDVVITKSVGARGDRDTADGAKQPLSLPSCSLVLHMFHLTRTHSFAFPLSL
jgi:hypothetical protein